MSLDNLSSFNHMAHGEDPLEITGDTCEMCGVEFECTDTRDVDGEEMILCRDCAMQVDDNDMGGDDDEDDEDEECDEDDELEEDDLDDEDEDDGYTVAGDEDEEDDLDY